MYICPMTYAKYLQLNGVTNPSKEEELKIRLLLRKEKEKYSNMTPKYKAYYKRAMYKGLSFELSEEQFSNIINMNCVYCNSPAPNGVDRKDNAKGYTLDNAQPCCTLCNLIKRNMPEKDFLTHIKKIYNNAIECADLLPI